MDSISRRLQSEDTEREEEGRKTLLYKYKGTVPIPSLGLMDDSAIITEVGYKSEIVNVSMNESSAEKNLQLNEKKCKYLKIGKKKEAGLCSVRSSPPRTGSAGLTEPGPIAPPVTKVSPGQTR